MAYRDVVLADRPLGYWQLSDAQGTNCPDISGNGNNGTIVGSLTLRAAGIRTGGPNGAITFPGSGANYVSIPTGAALTTVNMTVEAWFRTSIAGASTGFIYSQRTSGSAGWELSFDANLGFYNDLSGHQANAATNTAFKDGIGHHVVATCDGTTIRLYVDGQQIATGTDNSTRSTAVTPIIGYDLRDASADFNGPIQDVAAYTTVLSPGRVAAHYLAGKGAGFGQGAPSADRRRRR